MKVGNNKETKDLIKFFFEMGALKILPRTGWFLAGVKHPESIADHTMRSVFIAYILAKLEEADPKEAALICAFHEMGETRISDMNKVQSAYFTNKKETEVKASKDQLELLPKEVKEEFAHYILNEGTDNSKEQIIAKDADYLECVLQAKEYLEQGYSHAQNWIDNTKVCLRTESAKRLLDLIDKSNSQDWYINLKRIQRLC